MAIANLPLIHALRETADRLESGAAYNWAHFGRCNCGHLAQTLTRLDAAEIHRRARRELIEWSEIPEDYCGSTGYHLDHVIDTLLEIGLTRDDVRHLEDLSDRAVLERLPGGFRWLERNSRENAVAYMRAWADLLEDAVASAPGEVTRQAVAI
jgi:glycine/D-amino acid oxidase-like deaminating enzyme